MNDTMADEPSSVDETAQADDFNDAEEASDLQDGKASEEHVDTQAAEASAEPSQDGQQAEGGDANGASEPSEGSEADEQPATAQTPDATGGEAGEDDADGDDDGQLDELFLSPDEDFDDVIEVGDEGLDENHSDENPSGEHREEIAQLRGKVSELNERIETAEKERGEFKERWMRTAADLENLRKRAKREKEEQRKYGNDKLAMELLPALDNLERALAHAETSSDNNSIVDGVEMVHRQILAGFEKHGITGFEAEGEKFNPEQHEAIQQVETSEHDTGTVVEQFQKGYFIHDRLLRPALVSVAKRVADDDNGQQSEQSEPTDTNDDGEPDAGN